MALDGNLGEVSPQDGQVPLRVGLVEQECAVHQGIIGHLKERGGLTLQASPVLGVPNPCWLKGEGRENTDSGLKAHLAVGLWRA